MEETTQPSVVFKLLTFVTRLNSCCLFLWPRWQLLNCRSTLSVFHSPLPWESMIHLSFISCQVPGEIACLVHVLCALNPPFPPFFSIKWRCFGYVNRITFVLTTRERVYNSPNGNKRCQYVCQVNRFLRRKSMQKNDDPDFLLCAYHLLLRGSTPKTSPGNAGAMVQFWYFFFFPQGVGIV